MSVLPEIDKANVAEINQLITLIGLTLQPYMRANPGRVDETLRNVACACASIAGDQSGRLDALCSRPMGVAFYHPALLANFNEGYVDAFAAMSQVVADQMGRQ